MKGKGRGGEVGEGSLPINKGSKISPLMSQHWSPRRNNDEGKEQMVERLTTPGDLFMGSDFEPCPSRDASPFAIQPIPHQDLVIHINVDWQAFAPCLYILTFGHRLVFSNTVKYPTRTTTCQRFFSLTVHLEESNTFDLVYCFVHFVWTWQMEDRCSLTCIKCLGEYASGVVERCKLVFCPICIASIEHLHKMNYLMSSREQQIDQLSLSDNAAISDHLRT